MDSSSSLSPKAHWPCHSERGQRFQRSSQRRRPMTAPSCHAHHGGVLAPSSWDATRESIPCERLEMEDGVVSSASAGQTSRSDELGGNRPPFSLMGATPESVLRRSRPMPGVEQGLCQSKRRLFSLCLCTICITGAAMSRICIVLGHSGRVSLLECAQRGGRRETEFVSAGYCW